MADTPRLFISKLAFRLGIAARDAMRAIVRSDSVGDSLFVTNLNFGEVSIRSTYAWARFYHDGRGAIRARPGHKLVYFKYPLEQDPRLAGGYPKGLESKRRLTKNEFYSFLRDPSRGMIVRDSVGPAKGDPFMERIGRLFPVRASRDSQAAFSTYVKDFLGKEILEAKVTSRFVI